MSGAACLFSWLIIWKSRKGTCMRVINQASGTGSDCGFPGRLRSSFPVLIIRMVVAMERWENTVSFRRINSRATSLHRVIFVASLDIKSSFLSKRNIMLYRAPRPMILYSNLREQVEEDPQRPAYCFLQYAHWERPEPCNTSKYHRGRHRMSPHNPLSVEVTAGKVITDSKRAIISSRFSASQIGRSLARETM